MDQISLWITIAATVLIVAVAAGLWARDQSAKPLVAGLGLAMIPVGLFLTGVTELTSNGIRSLVDWVQRTPWTQTMTWGVGLIITGLVIFGVSRFLKVRPRAERTPKPVQAPGTKPAVAGRTAATPAAPGKAPAGGKQPAADPEDAEIEAILRNRGIM